MERAEGGVRLFRRKFYKRRCKACLLPSKSPWLAWFTKVCKCRWNDEAARYAKIQGFAMASRVWRESTFDVPSGIILVMDEQKL